MLLERLQSVKYCPADLSRETRLLYCLPIVLTKPVSVLKCKSSNAVMTPPLIISQASGHREANSSLNQASKPLYIGAGQCLFRGVKQGEI